jgi:hypothetical protein
MVLRGDCDRFGDCLAEEVREEFRIENVELRIGRDDRLSAHICYTQSQFHQFATMKETVIQLPDTLLQSIELLTQQTGITFDRLIQSAIEAYLQQQNPLPPSIGMGNSGLVNLSEQTHDLLWQDSQH